MLKESDIDFFLQISTNMTSYKNIDVQYSKDKYGETQRGIFAKELILKGELIRHCECGSNDGKYTRDQLLDIISKTPKLEYFVRSFSYMVDDDIYQLASKYNEERVNDECSFFNHSCEPNCGFDSTGHGYRALDNIVSQNEITYHYAFLETEASLINGLECKCGSRKCEGKLSFENYRDDEFVAKYFEYFTPYLKKRVIDLKDKWYSSSCYLKRLPVDGLKNVEDWGKFLFSFKGIQKDELIALFSTNEIVEEKHYFKHCLQPNCYIKDGKVFASVDIKSETELTLFF